MSREPAGKAVLDGVRRLIGLLLIVAVTVPVFGLLDVSHTGLTGRLMVSSASEHWRWTWTGLVAALTAGQAAGGED